MDDDAKARDKLRREVHEAVLIVVNHTHRFTETQRYAIYEAAQEIIRAAEPPDAKSYQTT